MTTRESLLLLLLEEAGWRVTRNYGENSGAYWWTAVHSVQSNYTLTALTIEDLFNVFLDQPATMEQYLGVKIRKVNDAQAEFPPSQG